jgi:polar amino acid transport system substrate-binding protein
MPAIDPVRRTVNSTSVVMLMIVCPCLWLAAAAQPAQLTLVSTAWPPFTNVRGQPRFALDLVEAALARVSVGSKTTIVAAQQFTPALLSGLFDGSAAAWKDPERERTLIFSRPYLENRLVLVGKHGADVSAKALADLNGKRVAIVEGYSYGDAIESAGPTWVRARSEEDCLTRVLKGGADYTLMDELVVTYILSNYPKESDTRLQIGATALLTRELYLTVKRTRADAQSIVDQFDAQLRGMIADRTYHRLLHVDWIRADVNGDGVPEYVPASDRAGASQPQHAYTLFTTPSLGETPPSTGFYFGGSIYSDWASVPENYKTSNSDKPDPRRSTASVFKFSW